MRSELDRSRVDLDDPERDVLVLDADSSQQEAIEAVRSGSHLVVHGPPGTGKSQTIANLIATLAADGKRVLFVAEKRAAIDAVVGRLDRVGLSDLVLDLHSGAHGRRRVARELVDALDRLARPEPARGPRRAAAPDPVLSRVTAPAAARRTAADRLTEHVRSLHEDRAPWGVTLHEVQEAVSAFAALPVPPRSRIRLTGAVLAALDRAEVTTTAASLTTVASLADWDAEGAGDPWFGAGIRTPDEAAEARERVERLAGGRVDDTARTLADVFRGIQLPEAPTANDWGHVLATVGEVRDTLEVFRPEVFDIPLDDLVTATGGSAYRKSVGSELGWLDRWRLRRQARGLLRPGRPPADLHVALAAASEQRLAWRQLAGLGGRPEIPVDLDRARAAHAALVADLVWLDDHLPGAETSGAATQSDAVTRLLDLDLPSLRARVDALAAAKGRLGVVPAVTTALDGLTASGLRPLVEDLRARAVPAERVTSEVEWVWWSSLSEEIALRDPRVAAHDGRALTRSVGEFAEADRAVVTANAERVRDLVADHVAEVVREHPEQETWLRAEGARARRLAPLRDLVTRCPELVTAVRPCWVMSPLVVASVLPPGPVVRRRGVRRGLAGAAGRGGVGDLAGPAGRRGRRLPPAAPHVVLHHGHRRRPRRGRRRRGDHRGGGVDPRRARGGPAQPPAVVALPLARRAPHRVRQRRGLRGVAGHLPRHGRRPGGAPGAGRGPRHHRRGRDRSREHAHRGRAGRRAGARARPHQPRPLARRHRPRHHPRDAGRGGLAAGAGRRPPRRAGLLRRGPARAVLRQEPRAGAG